LANKAINGAKGGTEAGTEPGQACPTTPEKSTTLRDKVLRPKNGAETETRRDSRDSLTDWARVPLGELERRLVAIKIESGEFGGLWLISSESERHLADDGAPSYTAAEARRMIGLPEAMVRQIYSLKVSYGGTLDDVQQEGGR
jgi:hypothetical protein